MELLQISRTAFLEFVQKLIGSPLVAIGVVEKDGRFIYDKLQSAIDLRLDFDETVYSPKHFLLPPREPLLSYAPMDSASYQPIYADTRRAIFGIHPCDLAAIALLDKVFSQNPVDSHYCTRRNQTVLIGMYPTRPAPYRFVSSMVKTNEPYLAADAMIIDMGDGSLVLEMVTDVGKEFFSLAKTTAVPDSLRDTIEKQKYAIADSISLPVQRDDLPAFLTGKEQHPVWETRGAKCFSCGSCVAVCPTCYCFDVLDELDISFEYGLRYRTWNGCMLQPFAKCSDNYPSRRNASDSLRHWLYRKQKMLLEKFGLPGCVGCGRCKKACVPDIAFPPDIDRDILGKEA